jgi:hypothetical protein
LENLYRHSRENGNSCGILSFSVWELDLNPLEIVLKNSAGDGKVGVLSVPNAIFVGKIGVLSVSNAIFDGKFFELSVSNGNFDGKVGVNDVSDGIFFNPFFLLFVSNAIFAQKFRARKVEKVGNLVNFCAILRKYSKF